MEVRVAAVEQPAGTRFDGNGTVTARVADERHEEKLGWKALDRPHRVETEPWLTAALVPNPRGPVLPVHRPIAMALEQRSWVRRGVELVARDMHLRTRKIRQATCVIEIEVRHHDVPHIVRFETESLDVADQGFSLRIEARPRDPVEHTPEARSAIEVVVPKPCIHHDKTRVGLDDEAMTHHLACFEIATLALQESPAPRTHRRGADMVDLHRLAVYHERAMCGRYTLTVDYDDLANELGLQGPRPPDWVPRFNIAPTQPVPVVTSRDPDAVTFHRWGLIPHWAKDRSIGNRMINARKETLSEKPSFRESFETRRCLVLADGFYEWKTEVKVKRPFYIRLASKGAFTFAGLWDRWKGPDGEVILSCTIITTEPNSLVAPLHDRMPAILTPEGRADWLDRAITDPSHLARHLAPVASEQLELYEVSTLVNTPKNDVAACVEPFRRGLFD